MSQGLSRSQKKKTNEIQKAILHPIIEYSKTESIVGKELAEQLSHLELLKEMAKWGLVRQSEIDELSWMASIWTKAYLAREELKRKRLKSENDILEEFDFYQIDTRKLYIGQEFKNYKELCKLLNVEMKTGKSRQLQERLFRCYFDYEKLRNSNEIIILEMVMKEAANQLGYKNSFFAEIYKPTQFKELCDSIYRKKQWNYVYHQVEIGSKQEYLCKHINEFTAYPEDTTIQQLTVEDINQYLLDYKNNLCSSLEEKWQEKADNEQKKFTDDMINAYDDEDLGRYFADLTEDNLVRYYKTDYLTENRLFADYLIKDDSERNEEITTYMQNK